MPIYEYQCRACGHQLEAIQRMSDAPLTDCPGCGQAELTKLVSAAGFRLKGTGWYETDFKHSGKPKKKDGEDKGEKGASDEGEKKSEGKGESKSDTKSDTSDSGNGGSSASKSSPEASAGAAR